MRVVQSASLTAAHPDRFARELSPSFGLALRREA